MPTVPEETLTEDRSVIHTIINYLNGHILSEVQEESIESATPETLNAVLGQIGEVGELIIQNLLTRVEKKLLNNRAFLKAFTNTDLMMVDPDTWRNNVHAIVKPLGIDTEGQGYILFMILMSEAASEIGQTLITQGQDLKINRYDLVNLYKKGRNLKSKKKAKA